MAEPFSSLAEFTAAHAPASGTLNEAKATDALADAADMVARWAPMGDEPGADYPERAARAERRVAAYLFESGGFLSSKSGISAIGGSSGFKNTDMLREVVRGIMADYYTGGTTTDADAAGALIAYREPFARN